MTFTKFLRVAFKGKDSALGDFANDWLADRERPQTVRSLQQLTAYLMSRDACPDALETAERAWVGYQAIDAYATEHILGRDQ
jgi:hypothetical protein